MKTLETIAKPLSVEGVVISGEDIAAVIDQLANTPPRFIGMDLLGPLSDHGFHWKQEVMNRLLQRWRKIGLIAFKAGRWSLQKGAWEAMQAAAYHARQYTSA